MSGVVSGIDEVHSVLGGLAVSWVDDLSDDALLGSLAALERHRRLLDATVMHLIAESDGRSLTDRSAGLATSSWLSREGRQPLGLARRKVIVARALRDHFDEVDAAMTKGEIGFEHAWVIVDASNHRIVDAMVELQGQLLDLVRGRTFARWRTEVRRIAALLDDEHREEREGDPSANQLSIRRRLNGSLTLNATFVGSWAETVAHVVPAIADQLFHRFQRDKERSPELEVPPRDALLALAFEEACRRAMACDLASTAGSGVDATVVIPATNPDPIDVEDPQQRLPAWFTTPPSSPAVHTHAESVDGIRLPDDTTRLLCCDPILHVVVVNGIDGRPLNAGTGARFANRSQRRAAAVRDGGCVFPGCHAPASWCDLHHVVAYPDGPTDLANLASLCRHHHRVTHRAGWTMHATDDGWFWWTTPNGDRFWSQRHQRQRAGPHS